MKQEKNRKLALFIPNLGGGGAERVFVNLAGAFAARNVNFDFVVGNLNARAYLDQVPSKVNLVNLDVSRIALSLPPLVKYLRREKPAVLLATNIHANCLAVIAGRVARCGTRVVVREVSTLSPSLAELKPLKRIVMSGFVRYCYPRAHKVIAVSSGAADDLVNKIGMPREKVTVLYSPIITADLLEKARQPTDHQWFAPNQPPVILSVGRLTQPKQQETLIKAFAIVRQQLPARLLLLGEGGKRVELESLITKLGLAEHVSLPGFVKNPFAFMARARVFVLSSAWEGLPGALIQALACGCPVISTDCPNGPREILRDGRLGRLVPTGDWKALARSIIEQLQGERQPPASDEDLKPFSEREATNAYLNVLLETG